jgi:hypothetical protein
MVKRNDFDPAYWGPPTWKVLFIFALSYPFSGPTPMIRQQYLSFYSSLQGVIPCEKCRSGFRLFLTTNPLGKALQSKVDLIKWLSLLYNNKRSPQTRINNLNDLAKIIKPDKTIGLVINQMRKKHPTLKFS